MLNLNIGYGQQVIRKAKQITCEVQNSEIASPSHIIGPD